MVALHMGMAFVYKNLSKKSLLFERKEGQKYRASHKIFLRYYPNVYQIHVKKKLSQNFINHKENTNQQVAPLLP